MDPKKISRIISEDPDVLADKSEDWQEKYEKLQEKCERQLKLGQLWYKRAMEAAEIAQPHWYVKHYKK